MTTMLRHTVYKYIAIAFLPLGFAACKLPADANKAVNRNTPTSYIGTTDSTNTAKVKWREFFTDPNLVALIDTALKNNQELNITLQEIAISRNEIRARKGEYLPFVGIKAGAGVDKKARYTNLGAMEAN